MAQYGTMPAFLNMVACRLNSSNPSRGNWVSCAGVRRVVVVQLAAGRRRLRFPKGRRNRYWAISVTFMTIIPLNP